MDDSVESEVPLLEGLSVYELYGLLDTLDQHLQVLRVDEIIRIDKGRGQRVARA